MSKGSDKARRFMRASTPGAGRQASGNGRKVRGHGEFHVALQPVLGISQAFTPRLEPRVRHIGKRPLEFFGITYSDPFWPYRGLSEWTSPRNRMLDDSCRDAWVRRLIRVGSQNSGGRPDWRVTGATPVTNGAAYSSSGPPLAPSPLGLARFVISTATISSLGFQCWRTFFELKKLP